MTLKTLLEVLGKYDEDATVTILAGSEYVAEGLAVTNRERDCVSIIHVPFDVGRGKE